MVDIRTFRAVWSWWLLPAVVMLWHGLALIGMSHTLYAFYSGYIYPVVRSTLGFLTFFVPVPVLYFLLVGCLILSVRKYVLMRRTTAASGLKKFWEASLTLLKALFVLTSMFYVLWAFHYYRPSVAIEMKLPESRLNPTTVKDEFIFISNLVNQQREWITSDSAAIFPDFNAKELSDHLLRTQEELLRAWEMPVYRWIRVKALYPKGILLRISTAGFYMPLTGEGYLDAGLHPLQWPFTMAHEMAHVQGLTDEGSCNFVGLVTCLHSKEAIIRYSGLLSYWGYLYRQMNQLHPEVAKDIRNGLAPGVKADMKAIRQKILAYPDIFPKFRNLVYDTYLKTHGVPEGLRSYDGVVDLMIRWKESALSFPIVPVRQ